LSNPDLRSESDSHPPPIFNGKNSPPTYMKDNFNRRATKRGSFLAPAGRVAAAPARSLRRLSLVEMTSSHLMTATRIQASGDHARVDRRGVFLLMAALSGLSLCASTAAGLGVGETIPATSFADADESHPGDNSIVRKDYKSRNVGYIEKGSWIRFPGFDFGDTGAAAFEAVVATPRNNARIEIRIDSHTGPIIGKLDAANTGSFNNYQPFRSYIDTTVKGCHDLYLVFFFEQGPKKSDRWGINLREFRFNTGDAASTTFVEPPSTPFGGNATLWGLSLLAAGLIGGGLCLWALMKPPLKKQTMSIPAPRRS
jgi:hypothetical protein